MKKLLQFAACALLLFIAVACSQGAAAIDKAYQQASEAAPAEKIATTLCNGDIKVETLTTEEFAKLGAVIGYLTYNGMYSSDFEAQVDMHQFGDLLKAYRQKPQDASVRLQIDQMTQELIKVLPNSKQ